MFPTSKCTNFPTKKMKWFWGKSKEITSFCSLHSNFMLGFKRRFVSTLVFFMTFPGIPTTGDSTSVTFASLTKVATCAKFLPSHPRLYSRFSMSKVSKCNAKQKLVTEFIMRSYYFRIVNQMVDEYLYITDLLFFLFGISSRRSFINIYEPLEEEGK